MIDYILFLKLQHVEESIVTVVNGNNESRKYAYKARPTGNVIIVYITFIIPK